MAGIRLVIEQCEGEDCTPAPLVTTPYVDAGWAVGGAALLALIWSRAQQISHWWIRWRGSLRRGLPWLFSGDWDERWLDPVAEWFAGRLSRSPAEVSQALRDPEVMAAALTSPDPDTVLAASLAQSPAELARAIEVMESHPLTVAEAEFLRRIYARLAESTAHPDR